MCVFACARPAAHARLVYLHKCIPPLRISIHTGASPPAHNSRIPLIMSHPRKKRRRGKKNPSLSTVTTLPSLSSSLSLAPQWHACVQWDSAVYTYHIHLISSNEISGLTCYSLVRDARLQLPGKAQRGLWETGTRARGRARAWPSQSVSTRGAELNVFCFFSFLKPVASDHRHTDRGRRRGSVR